MSDLAIIILTAPPDGLKNDGAAFIKIDGRESIVRAMELFANREGIVQTMIVIDKAEAEEIRRKIGSHLMFMGIKLIQSGGDWYEQLADAQKALSPDAKRVLVHDGARPAVPYTNIDALIEESTKHPAAGLALPVRGATVEAGVVPGAGKVTATRVAVLQWPMIYSRAAFDAVAASKKQPETIQFIEGSPLNVRCGIADASLVKAMIGLLPKPKMKVQSSPFEEAQW